MDTATTHPTRPSTVHHVLPPGPQAARAARELAARMVATHDGHCPYGTADDILLIVSELASNAVRHGRPPYRLTLGMEAGRASIAVGDASPALPRHRAGHGPLSCGGRGLEIIRALGAEIFVDPSPRGKQVIAVITWPTP
ncbi:ATP-binding protein [Streptomyces sp. NPDC058525]|uniref:ATP-binding protein n=1 Tax=Streptomyces sp. NPDC058525 TaxID=3346538 RepID=UPI00364BDC12